MESGGSRPPRLGIPTSSAIMVAIDSLSLLIDHVERLDLLRRLNLSRGRVELLDVGHETPSMVWGCEHDSGVEVASRHQGRNYDHRLALARADGSFWLMVGGESKIQSLDASGPPVSRVAETEQAQ